MYLYFCLNFAVNLKPLFKNVNKKRKEGYSTGECIEKLCLIYASAHTICLTFRLFCMDKPTGKKLKIKNMVALP